MTERARIVEKRRRSILQAIVELHAERGPAATSYSMIARRAKVSIPTVYKFFPTIPVMLKACMGAAAEEAPRPDPALFQPSRDLPARIDALVGALFAEHAFYHPWVRWAHGEANVIPGLARALAGVKQGHRNLIRQALGRDASRRLVTLASALLDYAAWKEMTIEMRLPASQARALLTRVLLKEASYDDSNR